MELQKSPSQQTFLCCAIYLFSYNYTYFLNPLSKTRSERKANLILATTLKIYDYYLSPIADNVSIVFY